MQGTPAESHDSLFLFACENIRASATYVVIDAEGIVRFRTSGGGNREPVGLESAIKDQLKAAGTRSKSER